MQTTPHLPHSYAGEYQPRCHSIEQPIATTESSSTKKMEEMYFESTPPHPVEPVGPSKTLSSSVEFIKSQLVPGTTRIRDVDGFVGTVMYVGPVASSRKKTNEVYAGIMWDDPSRGKHDGSVVCSKTNQLVRHFGPTPNPTQGSFLKLKLLDLGVNLSTTLLRKRYVPLDAPVVAPNNLLPHAFVQTSSGQSKVQVEFIGEMKIRKQQQPTTYLNRISLRREGISRSLPLLSPPPSKPSCGKQQQQQQHQEEEEEFHEFAQHITDLDLAGNLLCDWDETLLIVDRFPSLEVFSVAHNRIQDVPLFLVDNIEMSHQQDVVDDNNENSSSNNVVDGDCRRLKLDSTVISDNLIKRLQRLQVLNVNNCGIESFRTVQWISQCMPNLKQLCVANNNLSNIVEMMMTTTTTAAAASAGMADMTLADENNDSAATITAAAASLDTTATTAAAAAAKATSSRDNSIIKFDHLESLDCTNCQFDSWENQIDLFCSRMPKLQNLCLDNNPIKTIPPQNDLEGDEDAAGATTVDYQKFPELRSLQISGTQIASWVDVDCGVNSIRSLRSLKFKNCPLTEHLGENEIRTLCIARFDALDYFNGSIVTTAERTEAERRYVILVTRRLQQQQSQYLSSGGAAVAAVTNTTRGVDESNGVTKDAQTAVEDIFKDHPQYERLREKHKDLAIFSNAGDSGVGRGGGIPGTLSTDIVNVTIRSLAPSSCTMEPAIKRLPGQMNVGRLRAMCARIFALDYEVVILRTKLSKDNDAFPVDLDDDDRPLSYFGIGDGSEILVDEKSTTN